MRTLILAYIIFPIMATAQNWEQIIIASGSNSSNPMFFTEFNSELYFSASGTNVSGIGTELYKTNGTQAGTSLVMNLNPNFSGSSNPSNFTVFNGELYFTAEDGIHGRELFKTNGTTITLVKDINVGAAYSSNHSDNMMAMLESNGFLYFFAEDTSGTGYDLWKTDGTEVGTIKVSELNTNENSGLNLNFKKLGDDLYFVYTNNNTGHREIYKYDVLTNSNTSVLDVYPSNNTNGYLYLTIFDNKLFTVANGKLYYTNGVTNNFVILGTTGITSFDKLTISNNEIFFFGNSTTFGNQDVYKCYYSLADNDYKVELVYNFNASGNNFLTPVAGYLADDGNPYFSALNNKLYFAAREQSSPNGGLVYQIYETDGTITQIAIPVIHTGSPTSRPIYWITANKNRLYFLMSGDNSPEQLWEANPSNGMFTQLSSYTGPTTQPRQVFTRPLKSWNNNLYVEGTTIPEGYELWKFGTGTLSTETTNTNTDVKLYPNPTSNIITLNLKKNENYLIEVFNTLGQKTPIEASNNTINFSSVASGIYQICITNTLTNVKIFKKVVKK